MYRLGLMQGRRRFCTNIAVEIEPALTETPKDPRKFDKSRLLPQDRKRLINQLPYNEPQSWIHLTEKYQRKMFGRHGAESGHNPRICFQTKHDIEKQRLYEAIAEPKTLPEIWGELAEERQQKREVIQKREEDIGKKLEKLDQWNKELNAKIAKKEADALAAKERKERLVEDVRRHFGFNVDPRDERFKEMLELKEKEDKKKQKEAKKKAKEDKMLSKLLDKSV